MPTMQADALLQTQIDEFHEHGFIRLRGLFDAHEVAAWKHEEERLLNLEIINPSNSRAIYHNPQSAFPEKIEPVVDISPLYKELANDHRITRVIHEIFQDEPLLFTDKLLFRIPGMSGRDIHQDFAKNSAYVDSPKDVLAVSVQIDPASVDNGCMEFFEGYHDKMLSPDDFKATEINGLDPQRVHPMNAEAGDVLIFHSLTPHRNVKNITTRPRRALYLTYHAQRAGDLRGRYYENYISNLTKERTGEDSFI